MGDKCFFRNWLCLVVGVAVLLGAGPGWAQSVNDGKITGTVFLPTGEALAGATAQVTSPALVSGQRTTVSSTGGRFVFLSLPPGVYALSVSLTDFKTYSQEGIKIGTGDTIDVRVTMEIGAIEETLIVTAEAPIVDTRSSTIDTTFSDEILDAVPTARNTFYDLALTAPGMAAVGADESWLPSASAFGSATNENIFLVDGVNTTNPRGASWGSLMNVNYNTVEEVKVLSLGSKAEYGSFSGAAIDVQTKIGGNEFHGDVAYYALLGSPSNNQPQPDGFGADWLYGGENDELMTKLEDQEEINITLGGPVVKDRLWFYAGFADLSNKTDTPIFVPFKEYDAELYDIKLTADLGINHRLWIGYHHENQRNGNESWGDTWDNTMVYTQNRDNDTISAQYQWVVSDRNLFGLKFLSYDTEDEPTIPGVLPNPGYINWWKNVGSQSLGVSGEFPFVEAQKSERTTIQADFTHYADDFLGEHDIKFGVQYTEAEGNWQGGYFHGYANFAYPSQWWYGDYGTGYWEMYNRQYHVNPWLTVRESKETGVFVDDQWIVSDRVTLNLGLRYDNMEASYGDGLVYELPDSPSDINNPKVLRKRDTAGDVYDFETWSPRLGFAWTLTEDNKTVLRAHVGRYYAPIGVESLRRLGPDMHPVQVFYEFYRLPFDVVDANGDGYVDPDENRIATRMLADMEPYSVQDYGTRDPSWELRVAPGTDSPYTDQFNISIQRQLATNLAVEATYIYKNTDDLLVLWPYNADTGEDFQWEQVPYTTFTGKETEVFQLVLQDFNGDGETGWEDYVYVLDNINWEARNMKSVAGKKADRTYHGFQLTFTKRYANRWQAMASFNWTDTDGVAPRTVDQNWYIDGPMIMDTPFGSTLNNYVNNLDGPMLMTPKFMFKLAGSYTIPGIETDLGVRVRHDSGRAIFPIETLPTPARWQGEIWDGQIISPSGSNEKIVSGSHRWLPDTTVVDLSLAKTFRLGDRLELGVSIDVLNAFNEDSPNKVGFGAGDFGRVYSVVSPRTSRLGVKLSF